MLLPVPFMAAEQICRFSEDDRADTPVSLYAATKKADELMSHTYAHLYDIPLTGLRFFTVYGPFGRPDMAYYSLSPGTYCQVTKSRFSITEKCCAISPILMILFQVCWQLPKRVIRSRKVCLTWSIILAITVPEKARGLHCHFRR